MSNKIIHYFVGLALFLVVFVSCSEDTPPPDDQQYKGWVVGQAESGYGTILSTSNDGMTWVRQGSQSQASGVDLYDIQGWDQNSVWTVGGIYKGYGLILHSIDGGFSWIRQGTSTTIPNVRLYAVHAVSATNIWAAGDNSTILNTKDGGTTWVPVTLSNLPGAVFYSITSYGNNSLWIVGAVATNDTTIADTVGIILHSSDAGLSWHTQGDASAFPRKFLDVSAGNDSIVYASGTNTVFKTLNGGGAWQQCFLSAGRNLNGICAVDVENVWTVGDGDGIFHSTNGGQNWSTIVPSVKGFRLMGVTVADINRVWIVGAPSNGIGKGSIIYSRNAGDTWFIEPVPVEVGFRRVSFASARR